MRIMHNNSDDEPLWDEKAEEDEKEDDHDYEPPVPS